MYGLSSSVSPSLPSASRTRFELCGYTKREVELAKSFEEIESGNGDTTTSWDWVCYRRLILSTQLMVVIVSLVETAANRLLSVIKLYRVAGSSTFFTALLPRISFDGNIYR